MSDTRLLKICDNIYEKLNSYNYKDEMRRLLPMLIELKLNIMSTDLVKCIRSVIDILTKELKIYEIKFDNYILTRSEIDLYKYLIELNLYGPLNSIKLLSLYLNENRKESIDNLKTISLIYNQINQDSSEGYKDKNNEVFNDVILFFFEKNYSKEIQLRNTPKNIEDFNNKIKIIKIYNRYKHIYDPNEIYRYILESKLNLDVYLESLITSILDLKSTSKAKSRPLRYSLCNTPSDNCDMAEELYTNVSLYIENLVKDKHKKDGVSSKYDSNDVRNKIKYIQNVLESKLRLLGYSENLTDNLILKLSGVRNVSLYPHYYSRDIRKIYRYIISKNPKYIFCYNDFIEFDVYNINNRITSKFNSDDTKLIRNCIEKDRVIFIFLNETDDKTSHSALILYNPIFKIFEIINPHGSNCTCGLHKCLPKDIIKKEFEGFLYYHISKTVKLMNMKIDFPSNQSLADFDIVLRDRCILFTFWLLYKRLQELDKPIETFRDLLIRKYFIQYTRDDYEYRKVKNELVANKELSKSFYSFITKATESVY